MLKENSSERRERVCRRRTDRELGMDRSITRRDFLNGASVAIGASLVSPGSVWSSVFGAGDEPYAPEKQPGYYPPAKTGMRGSHDGSWEAAHAMRDGKKWENPIPEGQTYDLIVVGGGISGLSAAYFYRQAAGPSARILVLDNHDDFGGHAKRNEFQTSSRLLIGYGGHADYYVSKSLQCPGQTALPGSRDRSKTIRELLRPQILFFARTVTRNVF